MIVIFRYEDKIVRGINVGETEQKARFKIGPNASKIYWFYKMQILSKDRSEWYDDQKRLLSLGEFNAT